MADEKKQKTQQTGEGKSKKAKPEQVETAAEQAGGKPARPKATNRETARLRDRYFKEVLPALMKEFNLENPMAAPKLEKIVETEASRLVAALPGFGQHGVKVPDRREESGVGCGIGARGTAD